MRVEMLVGAVAISILTAASAALAADAPERLQRDLVQVKDGKFVYDDLSLCHLNLPSGPSKNFQMRSRAQAPATGVISRDQFVAIVTATEYMFAQSMAEGILGVQPMARAVNAVKCDPLEEPIGAVDLEVTTTMTKEGLQFEVTNTATKATKRSTSTWEEVLQ